jgi:hypothetical protein
MDTGTLIVSIACAMTGMAMTILVVCKTTVLPKMDYKYIVYVTSYLYYRKQTFFGEKHFIRFVANMNKPRQQIATNFATLTKIQIERLGITGPRYIKGGIK